MPAFDRRGCAAALILVVAAVASCRTGPAPAPDSSPGPGTSPRPLTPREASSPAARPGPAASLPPGHPPLDAAPPGASADAESVAGTITVAPSLASRASGEALFIIARAGADRHIVAVRREAVAAFPLRFRISGADAMTAGTTFAGPLELTARLSKSGDAVAARGDVAGVVRGVKVGAKDVTIVLDTVHQ